MTALRRTDPRAFVHVRAAIACGMLAALVCAASLEAQDRRGGRWTRGQNRSSPHTKNSEKLRSIFAPVVESVRRGTVRVYSGDKRVALGTVVGSNGLILTKASELGEAVEVRLPDAEQRLVAEVIGRDEQDDLALLRVEQSGLTKVVFAVENETEAGSFVVTVAPGATPLAYGVMSVARHSRKARTFLGVQSAAAPNGVRLTRILPNTAARAAGLKRGDVVLRVDGEKVGDRQSFVASIVAHDPGSKLRMRVLRGDEEFDVVAELKTDGDRHGPISQQEQRGLWGPLSKVRLGFAEVIQHDSVVRPEDCGGPVVNSRGLVVGINIARAGRVETLALTSKAVTRSLARILARRTSGELK